MKFFFPDSRDLIDPSFDFDTEVRSPSRVLQRDDIYAHEAFASPPFNGILLSKAIVDGQSGSSGKYSMAQRHRLLRVGVREFFRLQNTSLETMGDCGAFSYVREETPPYSVDEVIDFYLECGFDYGVSVDHVILGFQAELDDGLPGMDAVPADWKRRQEITLDLAVKFLDAHRNRKCPFVPVGVAQGWSPGSYAHSVKELQKLGYRYIAMGGLVPLKTHEIVSTLERVNQVRKTDTYLHLFGVTRCEEVGRFRTYGVRSFDSTSPLRQAFKDEKDNYYTLDRTYSAIRVPQVEGNMKLRRRIVAGAVDQERARTLERRCLKALKNFDNDSATLEQVLDSLAEYEELYDGKVTHLSIYREALTDRPWKSCPCEICRSLGIHVMLFRGAERNRRRGFHNLFVFNQRLQRELRGRKRISTSTRKG